MWVIMLRAAPLAAVLAALCILPSAFAAELLACQAKDAVNLQKDGTLKTDSLAQRAAQSSLVIDLSNGEVRSDGEQQSLKMTARQHGNETVLVPSLAPEFVRNVIRIHQTTGQIIFSQYILDLFISGLRTNLIRTVPANECPLWGKLLTSMAMEFRQLRDNC